MNDECLNITRKDWRAFLLFTYVHVNSVLTDRSWGFNGKCVATSFSYWEAYYIIKAWQQWTLCGSTERSDLTYFFRKYIYYFLLISCIVYYPIFINHCWSPKSIFSPKIKNLQNLGLIPLSKIRNFIRLILLSQIRKILRCTRPKNASPQICCDVPEDRKSAILFGCCLSLIQIRQISVSTESCLCCKIDKNQRICQLIKFLIN